MTFIITIIIFSLFSFGAGFIAGVKNAESSKVKPFKGN